MSQAQPPKIPREIENIKQDLREWSSRTATFELPIQTAYLKKCVSYLRVLTWGLVVIPWVVFIVWWVCSE